MLRIGIIGVGNIADEHIRGYLTFPDRCEIVALADLSQDKSEQKRIAFGLENAVAYRDAAHLLSEADVDLVSIASPPSSHAELSIAALRAGIHVIVEKPMAPSLEECDAMLTAQRESGRLLSVVAQNRFRDDLMILKEVLDSGLVGSISHVRIDSAWWRGLPYYDLWWRGTWESEGGGPTLNHAIHHIDLSLWLLGRPDAVVSMITNVQHGNAEVEDLSVAILRYGKALAQLTSSVVHHGERQEIVIQGERAQIAQPWSVSAETAQPNGFPARGGDQDVVTAIERLVAAHEPLAYVGHTGQIADVLDAVVSGRPPAIEGQDGRNAVELVTAIYESGIERSVVDLPLLSEDPYYFSGSLVERAPRFHRKRESVRDQVGSIVVGATSA
ncbi:putative dehydrogenase [Microbacterium sp. SLBN-154]|uniref:Gfo/Idh/MocA family protein n=1 Tax=Microbacterium sp. SLBN-154 TaxID=2768458 RepID=UPI00114FDCDA|nr:Gfo/Idh/MocA family oxidoreductase [Microbacterium sp. SLBN-154]TQK20729.1 putative dehydrogenase [Microbacterium sp. SLBN-154]